MDFSDDVSITQLRGNTPQKIIHGKYPWLMHVLRYRMGDAAFRSGVRTLFSRFRFRTYSLDDFVQVFAEAAHTSLDWWKTEWLDRPGVPVLRLSYSIESRANGLRLSGALEQLRNVYHMPVELGIYSRGQLLLKTVAMNAVTTPVGFEIPAQPDSVVLDPRRWLLARTSVIVNR
jgi:aminopeptidase N